MGPTPGSVGVHFPGGCLGGGGGGGGGGGWKQEELNQAVTF
jgi:hypothetical protein